MTTTIYIIHFDRKVAEHAQHYVGSTRHLARRLDSHRRGTGSKLTAHCTQEELAWEVTALFQASDATGRRIERAAKASHNAAKWCPKCTLIPPKMPGAYPYPLELCHFDLTYTPLAPELFDYELCKPAEGSTDAQAIKILMSQASHEVGFIPHSDTSGFQRALDNNRVLVARHLGTIVAYLIYTMTLGKDKVTINQLVVADQQRHQHIATNLLNLLQSLHPDAALTCRVRWDLPANEFWKRVGFEHTGDERHPTSRHLLHRYLKDDLCTIPR